MGINQSTSDGKHLSTHDLGATAALTSLGHELITVDKENPNKALFVFKRERNIEGALDEYWADQLEVKARRYFDSLRL